MRSVIAPEKNSRAVSTFEAQFTSDIWDSHSIFQTVTVTYKCFLRVMSCQLTLKLMKFTRHEEFEISWGASLETSTVS